MVDRQPGYYWVRYENHQPYWDVAYYVGRGRWNSLDYEGPVNDDDFLEIGERIERKN